MKSTLLTAALLVLTAAVTHAQLSFLPQVGFENVSTCFNYNGLSASETQTSFRANLKTDYRFKRGHGPYISLGTSPAPMNFSFNETGSLKSFQSAKSNLQFRIETGYQYTSKAIQFGKRKVSAAQVATTQVMNEELTQTKSCGTYTYKSSCGSKKKMSKSSLANNDLNMRLQPSLGFAYIPLNNQAITETANGFQYTSAWKTAIVPAMGFEFANGKQRFLTLTVVYTKPLGMNNESVTSGSESSAKAITTTINPSASAWGLTAGVPFSFIKNNVAKTKKVKKECSRNYYRRCSRS